jgi:archaellin
MKKIGFIMLFFLISNCFLSQGFRKDLQKSYPKKVLQQWALNDPQKLAILEYAVDHAIHFVDKPEEKVFDVKPLRKNDFSQKFTDYGIQIMDKTQYFSLPQTNKIMVVKSFYHLQLDFNALQ